MKQKCAKNSSSYSLQVRHRMVGVGKGKFCSCLVVEETITCSVSTSIIQFKSMLDKLPFQPCKHIAEIPSSALLLERAFENFLIFVLSYFVSPTLLLPLLLLIPLFFKLNPQTFLQLDLHAVSKNDRHLFYISEIKKEIMIPRL